jgi:nicotinate-nucleotide adenylyltransferase
VRIGLLGGSFEPPHNGHLLTAGDAFDELALDRVLFIPTAVQPFKTDRAATDARHRLAMVRLLVAGDERFDADAIEIERGGLSYTVDTLSALAERWPSAERYLLAGADVVGTFDKWREPKRILELATLVILRRADGSDADVARLSERLGTGLGASAARFLATRRVDISSTEIRQRVRDGKSIRGYVPDAVAAYIAAEQLYR